MTIDKVHLALSTADTPLYLLVHGEHDKHVSTTLRDTGVWEPYESTLILDALEEGACFVDVGANIGYFTVLAAQRVGASGQVIAFEPDPANFELLAQSIQLNGFGHVNAVQAGLAADNQTALLHLSDDNYGDHQLFPREGEGVVRNSVTVELINGAHYLSKHAGQVHVIKVDVQGAEYQVMKGLMPWLSSLARQPHILIELTPFALRLAGSSGRHLVELLSQLPHIFYIVDHINHELVETGVEALATWCDNVDSCEGDEGFMNIMLRVAAL